MMAKEVFGLHRNKGNGSNRNHRYKPSSHNIVMSIKLLNIQGLTQVKAIEIEIILSKNGIICLTETQHKFEKINFSHDIRYITSMPSMQDK